MKNKLLRSVAITGAICMALTVPSFAQNTEIRPISAEEVEIIPISYRYDHWSEIHIDQLSANNDVKAVFAGKNLDSAASTKDFQSLIRLVIDAEYDGAPDAMTREAAIYELTEIWAEKTGRDLDNIATIKMLIYPDTHKIDAKYNHGVTVAYMHDIAKGRSSGVFDPKAGITNGELAALINNTRNAIDKESNSGEQPVKEGRFETKGSYVVEDGKVVFDFELMSHFTQHKSLMFGSGQQFELTIIDEEGTEVYKYSDGKAFTLALIMKDIAPGESLKWQDIWDMTDKDGQKVGLGKYSAKVEIMVVPEEDKEQIEESQLTTVIDFELK